MGQNWNLLSYDRGEVVFLGKMAEAMWDGEARLLPYLIAKPVKPSLRLPITSSPCSPQREAVSLLLSLPDEIIVSILDQTQHQPTVLRFSSTCTRLWPIGWQHFVISIFKRAGNWRGTRIICEGEYNRGSWLPSSFLTADTRKNSKAGLADGEWDPESWTSSMKPDSEIDLSLTFGVRGVGRDPDLQPILRRASDIINRTDLPTSQKRDASDFIRGLLPELYPEDENWTLRNITAKAYVRGKRLNAAFHPKQRSTGLILPYPGFGEALVSQVSWSWDGSGGLGLHDGPWAGHRFEIVRDEEHFATCDEHWKDKTEEVVRCLAEATELEVDAGEKDAA